MTTEPTSRVLGMAEYEARWVHKSLIVELTARGVMPCANYHAQLEKRPEAVVPAMWDLVFYVQNICLKALRPFETTIFINDASAADKLIVRDAAGRHEVTIQQPLATESPLAHEKAIELDLFSVHALLPKTADAPHGCIIAPYGSLLPAIYYRVFGPAPFRECEAFKAKHCQPVTEKITVLGNEVPWPLVSGVEPKAG